MKNDISIFNIISIVIALASFFLSLSIRKTRRSSLEISLHKNYTDAKQQYLQFLSNSKYDAEKNNKLHSAYISEVLNELEYACYKYLKKEVDCKSFEAYYFDSIIKTWYKRAHQMGKENYLSINECYQLIENKKSACTYTDEKYILVSLVVIVIVYFIGLCYA